MQSSAPSSYAHVEVAENRTHGHPAGVDVVGSIFVFDGQQFDTTDIVRLYICVSVLGSVTRQISLVERLLLANQT